MNQRKRRREKGITLVALVITIILMLILAGIAISVLTGEEGLIGKAQNAADEYVASARNETDAINELIERTDDIKGDDTNKDRPGEVIDVTKEIDTSYGTIEVIWLDTGNHIISSPNEPNVSQIKSLDSTANVKKVIWAENKDSNGNITGWTESTSEPATNEEWYNYKAGAGTEDNLSSKWANININGDYFVWIPRYAYRITYYSDAEYGNVTGYYDGWGLWSATDKVIKYTMDNTIDTVEYRGKKYIVHPAFMNDKGNTYSHGGWDSDLTGIWVGKYEVSGSSSALDVVPNVASLRGLTVGEEYTAGIRYNNKLESHMMKNSEWGAVAYLTHSQYGRNGHEIDMNNSSTYITGNGGGSPIASSRTGTTYQYNTATGAKASTTGNVYGIYDMSGGTWDRVAAFNSSDPNGYLGDYGWTSATGLTVDSESTKYATKYNNITEAQYGTTEELLISKIGDALIEVNKSVGTSSTDYRNHWFDDYSYLLWHDLPFFRRGGYYGDLKDAGVFSSAWSLGDFDSSFRLTLCAQAI